MEFHIFFSLIWIPRCARGREPHKIIEFVWIFDFYFDSALRPGGDTAQDHNHKLCDPALRWARALALRPGPCALGPGPWALSPGPWALGPGPGALGPGPRPQGLPQEKKFLWSGVGPGGPKEPKWAQGAPWAPLGPLGPPAGGCP